MARPTCRVLLRALALALVAAFLLMAATPVTAHAAMSQTQKEALKERLWEKWLDRAEVVDVSDLGIQNPTDADRIYARTNILLAHDFFGWAKDTGSDLPKFNVDGSGNLQSVTMRWSTFIGTQADFNAYGSAWRLALAQVDDSMDAFSKTLVLHDWLCQWVAYGGMVAGSGGTSYGALVNRSVVCEGYAKTYAMLLNASGVQATYVTGTYYDPNLWNGTDASGNELPRGGTVSHAWNLVRMDDGQWYHVDVTGDDGLGRDPDGTAGDGLHHDLFLLNNTEIVQGRQQLVWSADNGSTGTASTRYSSAFWHDADIASRPFAYLGGDIYYVRGASASNARVAYRSGAFGAEGTLCSLDMGSGAQSSVGTWNPLTDCRVLSDGTWVYVGLPSCVEQYAPRSASGPEYQLEVQDVTAFRANPRAAYLTGIYFEDGELKGKGWVQSNGAATFTRGLSFGVTRECSHSRGLTYVRGILATCYATGNKPHYRCDACGALFSDPFGKVRTTSSDLVLEEDLTNHGVRLTELKTNSVIQATCDSPGYSGDYVCRGCGGTVERGVATPKHAESGLTVQAATCSKTGLREAGTCAKCGRDLGDEVLPVDQHNHDGVAASVVTTVPTCATEGVRTNYICDACHTIKSTEAVAMDPANHEGPDHEEVIKAGTCTDPEVRGRVCDACGGVKSTWELSCDPDNHGDHEAVLVGEKDPSPTEHGYTGDLSCSGCGALIAAGEETCYLEFPVVRAATCTQEGERSSEATCPVCQATFSGAGVPGFSTTIPRDPTNHTGGTKVVGARASTCSTQGATGDTVCLGCGATITASSPVAKDASNHTGKQWSQVTKAATYDAAGVRTYYACDACKSTASNMVVKTESVPKLAVPAASLTYQGHVQSYGWMDWVKDGALCGTSGQSKRVEAFRFKLVNKPFSGSIEYRGHVQSIGWQGWVRDGAMAGTSGRSKRVEAVQIRLTDDMAKYYDVWYRAHVQSIGWQGWVSNGQMAGTSGQSKRVEALQVMVLPKGQNPTIVPSVTYRGHVQSIGWQNWVQDGMLCGTSGRSLRVEGFRFKLATQPVAGSLEYRGHVQSIGWQGWVRDGAMAGTSGRSLRVEALQLRLTGKMAEQYDVWYRAHVQSIGWQGWVKNGATAGTSGRSLRIEAIQVKVLPKGKTP